MKTLLLILIFAVELQAQAWSGWKKLIPTSDITGLTGEIGQTAQDSSGWQDNGTWVGLRTSTDSVGLGARPLFGYYDIYANPGGTNNGITLLSLRRASTATPTTNFAAAINFYLESSTTEDQLSTRLISAWQTATHATRTSNLRINLVNSGTSSEYYRFTPTGLSIFGATTPTAKLEIYSRGTATNAIYVNQDASGSDSSIVVLPNGNLGLATTSPSQRLHVVGNVLKNDVLELHADTWQATAANGAATALSDYIPVRDFDASTAETLTVDLRIPSYFGGIDSMQLEVKVNSTAGDSISFVVSHRDVNITETYAGVFADSKTFVGDLGTTANVNVRLSVATALTGIAANDRIIFKIYRDVAIANDVVADGRFVGLYLFGRGLK